MNDIKNAVAKNISELRQSHGMTQIELAERLNYSDKAISKWERAESIPDVTVLVTIAELFGVTLDYLVHEEHTADERKEAANEPVHKHNRHLIAAMSVMLVWFISLLVFVLLALFAPSVKGEWLAFLYGIPAASIVHLVFNSIWFETRRNYLIISVLMWSILLAIHVTVLVAGYNLWLLYLLGIPGQLVIFMWSRLKKAPSKK
jgi:transcriptional regulator with XRE-family HTH domain